MTANEMKILFLIKFDKLFDFGAPAYDDRQISKILTDAQFRIFIKTYNPLGNKYKKGFESDEKRRRDLDQLIKPALYSSLESAPAGVENINKPLGQNGIHPNGIFLEMPIDYLYPIEETCKVDNINREFKVVPVTHDEYSANIYNPYGSPYITSSEGFIWRMDISRYTHAEGTSVEDSSKRLELILPSGNTLVQYRVRYLSMPSNIVVDTNTVDNQRHCILDASIHAAIIDEAIAIASAASKPDEYKLDLNETLKSE